MNLSDTLTLTTPTDREVVVTREFAAPRRLVFDALTKPELLKRWYGPTGWTLEVCEVDLKVGGKWHYVLRQPEGKRIGQYGTYVEIVPGERLVNTESWEDWDPGESRVTTVLTEKNGKTTFIATILFPSQEVRDIIQKSGMEESTTTLYGKLDELLAEIE